MYFLPPGGYSCILDLESSPSPGKCLEMMRRSRIPHKLPFSSCGKLNDRDYTTLVHHLERTNPFSTCPFSMTSPMELLLPARNASSFLTLLNRFKDFFLLYFDVVWQVDVFYRLEDIFEAFTNASWEKGILFNEKLGWPCSPVLHWKAQQLYKAVSVKAGLFKLCFTKQKWGAQCTKWLLWKLTVLKAQIFYCLKASKLRTAIKSQSNLNLFEECKRANQANGQANRPPSVSDISTQWAGSRLGVTMSLTRPASERCVSGRRGFGWACQESLRGHRIAGGTRDLFANNPTSADAGGRGNQGGGANGNLVL